MPRRATILHTVLYALATGLAVHAAPAPAAETVTVTEIQTYTLLIETILIEPTTITVGACTGIPSVPSSAPVSAASSAITASQSKSSAASASQGGSEGSHSSQPNLPASTSLTPSLSFNPSGAGQTSVVTSSSAEASDSASLTSVSQSQTAISSALSSAHASSATSSVSSAAPSACPTATVVPGAKADNFKLNTTFPGIPFAVPQSYAGYISVDQTNLEDERQLYFFYTEADESASDDDIIVWFNGGPGCSSLEGLFQENGPFQLPFTPQGEEVVPILNPYSNHKAAHAIWIDSPGNTGFSHAGKNIQGLKSVAEDVTGFLGESFAGAMIPYMASRIYSDDSLICKGINLKGVQINDPSWANDNLMQQLPIYPYAVEHKVDLTLNDTQLAEFQQKAAVYGLDTYVQDNLVYPPKGPLVLPDGWNASVYDLYDDILSAWNGAHCSSVYNIAVYCPSTDDPLGYPLDSTTGPSPNNFLNNQTGFKEAIRADTNRTYLECAADVYTDLGEPAPVDSVMPLVIERSERVVVGGGDLDVLLLTTGSALAIQNMTWAGAQGLQDGSKVDLVTSQGVRGQYHTERGLSLVEFYYAGHMVPQDDQEAGFRTTQFLIGTLATL